MLNEDHNDSILNVPLGNLQPGALAGVFAIRARLQARKRQEEFEHDTRLTESLQHKHEEDEQIAREDFQRREELLLARLDEQERRIIEDAEALDRRAIKLADGRRAYVDGDKYRDAEGHELHGADRAEAEVLHLDHPDAATWRDETEIQKRFAENARLRASLQEIDAADPSAERKLAMIERAGASKDGVGESAIDVSQTDYMKAYGLSGPG